MKRGGPLSRRTPLTAKTPLKASTGLSRRSPLTPSRIGLEAGKGLRRSALVSKRPTVGAEERRARKLVRARSGGMCERCQSRPGSEYCHRKARSQSGEWCPSNGWWGCHECHRGCHEAPAVAYEQGWHVRSHQNPAVVPMWMAGRGLVLLRADGSVAPYGKAA